jgi:hypothetical protein
MKRSRTRWPAYVDGFPSYVRGWVSMAREKTMQRGYRDVGYLLAPKVKAFRPAHIGVRSWFKQVVVLAEHIEANDKVAVKSWVCEHYPALIQLIPERRHSEFVSGLVERSREDEWAK